ncbi:hypothetical protein FQN50_004520 [Emmonsiellopsis sp. PD_5]|nr:hypothetical protein FQN50_004520 [Emmonsiellopsis sp. PD_5]
MSTAKDIFDAALADFKKRLTSKELEDFKFTTLDEVRMEIIKIQDEQDQLKTMRDMTRIQSFVEAMTEFGKVIECFLNVSDIIAFIWGPVKFLLQVARNWTDSFDILLDAYKQIGEEIPLLLQYSETFEQNPHMINILGFIYADILEFHKRAIRFFSGNVWHQVIRSAWKDFNVRFKQILDSLRSHKELIHRQSDLLHVVQYQKDRLIWNQKFDQIEEAGRKRKYLAVMEWTSCGRNKSDHESFVETRGEYKGSGDWILEHEKLKDWKKTSKPASSALWLNGIPGAGKTILASAIIDDCLSNTSFNTGYFYCKEGDPEGNTFVSILRGLINQLMSQNQDLVPHFYDKYSSSGETSLSSVNLGKQLLQLLCDKVSKLFIVIDGLDECNAAERKLVLPFFKGLLDHCDKQSPGKLRLLFISQDYNDIRNALATADVLSLKPTDNEHDIKIYVSAWTKKIRQKHDLDDVHTEYIKESTCSKARGMFLFAKLVMRNLYDQPMKNQLLEEIKASRFPEGLAQAYERILDRIQRSASSAEWNIACKLLGWMVCAKRPLKWNEIQGAISIDPKGEHVDWDGRRLRIHIKDLCGSLVDILRGGRIELVHSTAKMYIGNSKYVSKPTVECNLTALCLKYLTFEYFEAEISDNELRGFALSGCLAFQDYAVAKWFHHVEAMVDGSSRLLTQEPENENKFDLEDSLNDFAQFYADDLGETIAPASEERCAPFKNLYLYSDLVLIYSHIHQHQHKPPGERNNVGLKSLAKALTRNRALIEGFTTAEKHVLDEFYGGERKFKCPKLTCFFFHEGFKDAKSRDNHINRHDRPFSCTVPDCSAAEFGFSTNKDLEKHVRAYHPEVSDQMNLFPTPVVTPKAKTPWKCERCGKKFTRGFILKNHILSHNGARPFSCPECGKSFTRANDCRRHQKIHERRG